MIEKAALVLAKEGDPAPAQEPPAPAQTASVNATARDPGTPPETEPESSTSRRWRPRRRQTSSPKERKSSTAPALIVTDPTPCKARSGSTCAGSRCATATAPTIFLEDRLRGPSYKGHADLEGRVHRRAVHGDLRVPVVGPIERMNSDCVRVDACEKGTGGC